LPLGSGQLAQLRKLTEVSRKLTYAWSVGEILSLTVDHAAELLQAPRAVLVFMDEHGMYSVRGSHGLDPDAMGSFHEPLDNLVDRLRALLEIDRFLGVPLVIGGHVTGVLAVSRSPTWDAGNDQEEWLLSALADQAAVALEKARTEDSNQMRDRLFGIVGHDLRTPLNAISLAASVLQRSQSLSPRESNMVNRIISSAGRMSQIISQTLDLTRIRLGGGLPVTVNDCDLREVVADVVEELQLVYTGRVIRVETDVDGGDSRGAWDRARLAQLLSNLIRNAIQHGARDQPVSVRIERSEGDLVLSVHNAGEPIPEVKLPVLFDPLRRGQLDAPEESAAGPGLGLGLFIVQHIARAHGGDITVKSTEPEGTTFVVRLPRRARSIRPEGRATGP
jgi:sigma-B regulation protein RsbU (phosphoserine phosphatase)